MIGGGWDFFLHHFVHYSGNFMGLQNSLYCVGIPTIQLQRFSKHFSKVQNHFSDFIGGQNVDSID